MEFCQDSQFKLEIIPSTTEEYVDSLTFLDEIQEQVRCYQVASSLLASSNYIEFVDTQIFVGLAASLWNRQLPSSMWIKRLTISFHEKTFS